MAGHSKWSNIKHRKAGQDAKRAKIFTKIIRELTVAARDGGAVVEDNPQLRLVVEKAKAAQMPKDTMERAIQRGAGGLDGSDLEPVAYEGYGPGGVAIMIEAMTDNKNRTVAEVRHAFSRAGGNLGTDGSVAYLFNRKGTLNFPVGTDEEAVMEIAVEAGALDLEKNEDGSLEVQTLPEDFQDVKDALIEAGFEPESAEVAMIPQTYSDLDAEVGEKVLKLLDAIEDLDDVQNVYTNANFPDELQEA
ncbi:MAG: YebC/PmpR family DNA-binding transcriptional regulator [Gammaproteobacteria bacterium]|nr:YebC/PmpR family DNA-binding transcriptional regulator [Gammaproteobacteria bacterium]